MHSFIAVCQPIKRIPAYLYFNGIHQSEDFATFSKICTQEELHRIYNTLEDKVLKQEFLNQITAYRVLESVLLNKPFNELTILDVQRLNAILLYKLHIPAELSFDGYAPGLFRRDFRLKRRFSGYVWDYLDDADLQIWASLIVRMEIENQSLDILYKRLNQQERSVVNKIYTVYEPADKIVPLLDQYVVELHADLYNNDFFLTAANAFYRLCEIHPFCDGNGRTSRLVMNLVLMHGGYLPIFIENKVEFVKVVHRVSIEDLAPLRDYMCTIHESMKVFPHIDLNGISIYEEPDQVYSDSIKSLFERIMPHVPSSLDALEQLTLLVEKTIINNHL